MLRFDNPDGGVWKQGFDISYHGNEWDKEPLEVFVVPHSHNDPGWLKTFDDYYRDQTQHILNNMLLHLAQDTRLLRNGQLEMATGGWVMPDEANTHYFALIDQLMEGHQWLEANLGVKPTSGWAVDPFGHSPSMAYFLKRAGLASMLIQRVHYAVKKQFATKKTLEFYWRQNWDPASSSDMMCHMMPFYSYDIPHTCGPDPSICCQFDFHRLPGGRISCPWRIPPQPITDHNIRERSLLLLDQYRKKSRLFRTGVLLVPLGDDFRWAESSEWQNQFNNYQRLFTYLNTHSELHVKAQFGTISDYFRALRNRTARTGINLPVLSGDFFTYADRDDHYWSGYYTSRPFYKRLDRLLESHLRAAEILYSLTLAEMRRAEAGGVSGYRGDFPAGEAYQLLIVARRNLGLFQHHDAVTGTSKDWVVMDYGKRLYHSILALKEVLVNSAHWLILKDKAAYRHEPSSAFLQMDEVQPSQDTLPKKTILTVGRASRMLVVYNPVSQKRSAVVSIYVDSPAVRVVSMETGQPIPAQLSAVWAEPTRMSLKAYKLSFIAEVPPLALVLYHLLHAPDKDDSTQRANYTFLARDWQESQSIDTGPFKASRLQGDEANAPLVLANAHIQTWTSPSSGLLEKMKLAGDGLERHVQVRFFWYGTSPNHDKSGAYLFLPDGEAKPYSASLPPQVRVTRGPVFSEITSCFQHFTHTLRLFHVEGLEGHSVELSNLVDIRSEVNRELVMRLVTDVASGDHFYTDLNGFQIQPRRTLAKLPLQANFYPMTTMAYVQDSNSRLTLLTGQSLGVASLKSGNLEVVLDRRLQQDDNRGLGQGVTDNKLTASCFRLLLERRRRQEKEVALVSYPSLISHASSLHLLQPLLSMAVNPASSAASLPLLPSYQPIRKALPCDLHLLNLRTIQNKEGAGPSDQSALILHRKGFDCDVLNTPAHLHCGTTHGELDLDNMFTSLSVHNLQRVTLTLMHPENESGNDAGDSDSRSHHVKLEPMEVRTIQVQIG
ncbi:alpha-mannosidase 2 isoform X2 [Lampris incognitus]|uniref:alpha-mannosidase 2 isoform X2 n=1 Tax=Lampris incognitus TaxID=2546036 RepID=UPI0024B565F0|nr:alpha-mannosidase 2 isoform X2 [Lampris incognitus]